MPGSRVAGYRLEEQIGRGGMAVVFRARDERLGRLVALKVLAPGRAQDPGFRQRFLRESHVAAAVDHPHVIPLFEAGEDRGVLFIAMRLVRGGDVRSLLAAYGPLEPGRACGIVSAVAAALDAAHADGLVHRDVKPENMLLDGRPGRPDHVYLSDFGLGKEWQGPTRLTESGLFVGTVEYASPEQIEGRPLDGRADQYSLGCVAFELLSGQSPFRRQNVPTTMQAHLSEPPPKLTAWVPGLPPTVDEVFAKVLAKYPTQRFGSCGEFAVAMQWAMGPAGPDTVRVHQPPPPPPRRHRRGIWAAAIGGAVAVAAALAAAVLLPGSGPPKVEALSAIVKPMTSRCWHASHFRLTGVTAATGCHGARLSDVTIFGYQFDNVRDYQDGFGTLNSRYGWQTPPKGKICPASVASPVGAERWYSPKYSVHPGQILECIVASSHTTQWYVLGIPTQRTILFAYSNNFQDLGKWFTDTNPG